MMTRHHHHRHNHNNDYHIISDYCGCLRTRDATVCLFVFLSVIWYMVTLLSSTSSLSSWLYHFYFLQLSYFTLWLPSMLIIIFLSIFKFRYIFSYFCFFYMFSFIRKFTDRAYIVEITGVSGDSSPWNRFNISPVMKFLRINTLSWEI